MQQEYNSLIKNQVWELVPLPENVKAIGSKWHFANKYDSNGNVTKHKARFVAKGYSQQQGIDYKDTYSPTTRLSTIRIILQIVANLGGIPKQMDIKTAYLNAQIEENVYMLQAEGFEKFDSDGNPLACKLNKSVYGLKQLGRNWFLTLKGHLETIGFEACIHDPCLFIKKWNNTLAMICVWVDDIIFYCPETDFYQWFEGKMSYKFITSECSDLKWFLGMKFEFSDGIIEISQEKFIDNLLIKFGMSDCKSVSTPLAEKQKFTKFAQTDKPDIDNTTYRNLVGSLNYLALSTRPDLSQAAHALGSFLENSKMEHWIAAKNVLRYLKCTKHLNLTFRKATSVDDNLAGYSDSDWAGNIGNRKSTTGFCFNMCKNSGSISWEVKSKILLLHLQQRLKFTHVFQLLKNWNT